MRCNHCPAIRTEGYEYPESYCLLGAETTREYADGWSGCYRTPESVRKQVAKIEEKMAHQYDGIDEWIVERQIKEDAMAEAFEQEIHDYKYGTLYLCFKDTDGHYYPIGSDPENGKAPREMTSCLLMAYEDKMHKAERKAYNDEVPEETKKKGRKERPDGWRW